MENLVSSRTQKPIVNVAALQYFLLFFHQSNTLLYGIIFLSCNFIVVHLEEKIKIIIIIIIIIIIMLINTLSPNIFSCAYVSTNCRYTK